VKGAFVVRSMLTAAACPRTGIVRRMENQQDCVWTTSKERWDSFLNDPELARAIDTARSVDLARMEESGDQSHTQASQPSEIDGTQGDDNAPQQIGERLRAYETPITDDILRQSIL